MRLCRRSGAAATVNIFSFAVSIGKPSPSSMSMAPATDPGAASATPFRNGVLHAADKAHCPLTARCRPIPLPLSFTYISSRKRSRFAAVSFVLACSSPKALVLILRARVMCRIASLCKPCCSSLPRHTREECRVRAAARP